MRNLFVIQFEEDPTANVEVITVGLNQMAPAENPYAKLLGLMDSDGNDRYELFAWSSKEKAKTYLELLQGHGWNPTPTTFQEYILEVFKDRLRTAGKAFDFDVEYIWVDPAFDHTGAIIQDSGEKITI